jgi:catechol 2,3-dioxygenase-like lactoylglutathione lyase family enzyme
MKIKDIDHFVITTADLQACLDFYVGILGMEHVKAMAITTSTFPVARFPSIQRRVSSSRLPIIQHTAHKIYA